MLKKLIFSILILLASLPLYGQFFVVDYLQDGASWYTDLTITNADKDTLYVIWDAHNRWNKCYMSGTLPTDALIGTAGKTYSIAGDLWMTIEYNNTSGSGTCGFWTKRVVYDPKDGVYTMIHQDSTFLDIGTPNVYTASSVQMITPTDTREYGCLLTSTLRPVSGFAIIGKQTGTHVGVYSFSFCGTKYTE